MEKNDKPKDLEKGHTPQADFDRNRDGLYGGLPKARDPKAPKGLESVGEAQVFVRHGVLQ